MRKIVLSNYDMTMFYGNYVGMPVPHSRALIGPSGSVAIRPPPATADRHVATLSTHEMKAKHGEPPLLLFSDGNMLHE